MSGIGATSGSATQSTTVQNNTGPVTFTGVASGIDWNSVIQKETQLTLAPITQYDAQISKLNSKNSELIKINNLMASVQNSLVALSDPSQYSTYTGSSSNTTAATATGIAGVPANPGTYTIMNETLATSTQVTSALASVVSVALNTTTASLGAAGFQVTPTVPTTGQGTFTVDGVQIKYNLDDAVDFNLTSLLATIQFQVDQSVDPDFTAGYDASTGMVTFSSDDAPISIGSPSDQGNLAAVLKLNIGSVNNTSSSGFVQSAGPIGGLNQYANLNAANLITAPTSGTFTINGVSFTINAATQSLNDILTQINSSTAGVIASYNNVSGQIQITNQNTGPQSVIFGSVNDTSNFLQAVGLPVSVANTAAVANEQAQGQTVVAVSAGSHGASTLVGQQAVVQLLNPAGGTETFYSSSNEVTNAIQGISINLQSANDGTPFTITVTQDASTLETNIQAFASAYNAAVSELNAALQPPVVQQNNPLTNQSSGTTSSSSQLTSGGVLFGDITIEQLRDELVSLAQSLVGSAGSNYNSLDAIGLPLTSSFTAFSASTAGQQTNVSSGTIVGGGLTSQVMDGTDGTFSTFDAQTFAAAFEADPSAIEDLFNNASDGIVTQFGTYLTSVTGQPTILESGASLGTIPNESLLQGDEDANTDSISSLQQYIQRLQDSATQQANVLQDQATQAESAIAGYQATQAQITQLQNSGEL